MAAAAELAPSMTGVSLRTCARDCYLVAGRGAVVTLNGEDETRYSTFEELRGVLVAAPELERLIEVAEGAVATYDPETEAVVLASRHEDVGLYLVRADEVVTVWTLLFVMPT
jgi:hypothetical protein